MTKPLLPYSVSFDLASVPDTGRELILAPSAEIRRRIAAWAKVSVLEALDASIRIARLGENYYFYEGRFDAALVQTCAITLEPVHTKIARDVRRVYCVQPRTRQVKPVAPPHDADEETEHVDGSVVDLAAPLLEELSLAIDPYLRAPGAGFAVSGAGIRAKEGPFTALKQLKDFETPAAKSRKS